MAKSEISSPSTWGTEQAKLNSNFNELYDDKHTHTNKTVLDNTTAAFTTAEKDKLGNLSERFRGVFANLAAAQAAVPSPSGGMYFANSETATLWSYNGTLGAWEDTGTNTAGDMLASTYDPQNIGQDAFNRANHTGTQPISTVDGLFTELQGKANWNGFWPAGADVIVSIGSDQLMKPTAVPATVLDNITGTTGNVQTQIDAINNRIPASFDVGGYNSDTASDTWNEICRVGDVSIEARNPSTGNVAVRIYNTSGGTVVACWMKVDQGTITQGRNGISNNAGFEIERSSTASGDVTFSFGAYTSPGVNTESYSGSVYINRTTSGVRIAADIRGVV